MRRWTLRFRDPAVEAAYRVAIESAARQRLQVALLLMLFAWVSSDVLGPILTGVPQDRSHLAALIGGGVALVATLVTFLRRPPLTSLWAIGAVTTLIGCVAVLIVLWDPVRFAEIGGLSLLVLELIAFAVVRPPWIVGIVIGAGAFALFVFGALELGASTAGGFQVFLFVGAMAFAVTGARLLELAERNAFAQAQVVADLHRRIDTLFRQYLSPDVAQTLVADPTRAALGGDVLDISVLFADLRGFTPFSERTSPDAVLALLNAAFGAAVPAVLAAGGTIVYFAGDALMAIFNAPTPQADHALRACRAGLALQDAVAGILADPSGPQFRVGISTGPAVVGNIGSAELRTFSAIGDTVNTAARLQTFAEPATVVIGRPTLDVVAADCDVVDLGATALKGKVDAVPAYRLVAIRSAPAPAVVATAPAAV
jgi:class 3 adenylate cyclase